MKTVRDILLILTTILTVFNFLLISKVHEGRTELITAYTQDDIIYLQGTHVTCESGRCDIQCETRNRAIEIFENLTVPK